MSPVRVPGIGWRVPLLLTVLALALVACLAAFLVSSATFEKGVAARNLRLSLLGEQDRLAQIIFRQAPRAMRGSESAFSAVKHARAEAAPALASLHASYERAGAARALVPLEKEWSALDDALDLLIAAEDPILGLRESLEVLQSRVGELEVKTSNLLEGAPGWDLEPAQLFAINTLRAMSTRLAANFRRALDSSTTLIDSEEYGQDAKLLAVMGDVITGLALGDPSFGIQRVGAPEARRLLDALGEIYRGASASLRAIMSNTLVVTHVRETGETVAASAERIPALGGELRRRESLSTGAVAAAGPWSPEAVREGLAVGASALTALIVLVVVVALRGRASAERARAEEVDAPGRDRQEAVWRLLDEVRVLSRAEAVPADPPGETVDALERAVEALRAVTAGIEGTSGALGVAAERAHLRAVELDGAAQAQGQRVAELAGALREMSQTLERVAGAAETSRETAARSAVVARGGEEALRDALAGLDAVRSTLRESVRSLEGLAESCKALGDAVGRIEDIADQTNVLALNAAIQAPSGTGGFPGADEVQRLAEQAGAAARRAESLVEAARSDAGEAIASIEAGTARVSSRLDLAAGAEAALGDAHGALEKLAGHMQDVAAWSGEHLARAGELARTLEAADEAARQIEIGAGDTARAVAALSELTQALREPGFALPEPADAPTLALPRRLSPPAVPAQDAPDGSGEISGGARTG